MALVLGEFCDLFPLELAAREYDVLVLGDDFPLSPLAAALAVVLVLGDGLEPFPLELLTVIIYRGNQGREPGEERSHVANIARQLGERTTIAFGWRRLSAITGETGRGD